MKGGGFLSGRRTLRRWLFNREADSTGKCQTNFNGARAWRYSSRRSQRARTRSWSSIRDMNDLGGIFGSHASRTDASFEAREAAMMALSSRTNSRKRRLVHHVLILRRRIKIHCRNGEVRDDYLTLSQSRLQKQHAAHRDYRSGRLQRRLSLDAQNLAQ